MQKSQYFRFPECPVSTSCLEKHQDLGPSRPVDSAGFFVVGPLGSFIKQGSTRECALNLPPHLLCSRSLSLRLLVQPPFCWGKGNYFTSLEEAPLARARSLPLWIHPSPTSCQCPAFLLQDLRCRRWLELISFQFTARNPHQCLTANTP